MSRRVLMLLAIVLAAFFAIAFWPKFGVPGELYVGWPYRFYVTQDDVLRPYWSWNRLAADVAIILGIFSFGIIVFWAVNRTRRTVQATVTRKG